MIEEIESPSEQLVAGVVTPERPMSPRAAPQEEASQSEPLQCDRLAQDKHEIEPPHGGYPMASISSPPILQGQLHGSNMHSIIAHMPSRYEERLGDPQGIMALPI